MFTQFSKELINFSTEAKLNNIIQVSNFSEYEISDYLIKSSEKQLNILAEKSLSLAELISNKIDFLEDDNLKGFHQLLFTISFISNQLLEKNNINLFS